MPTTQGLVGYWSFDENGGNTAFDYSGNNNRGTLVNSPTWVDGVLGKALKFNGSNSTYVEIPNTGDFSNANKFSISFWVKSNSITTVEGLICKANDSLTGQWYIVFGTINSNGRILLRVCNNTIRTGMQTTISFTDNKWHHIVTMWNTGAFNIYVDGNNQILENDGLDTGTVSTLLSSTVPISIGRRGTGGNYISSGIIDELRLYNRSLTQSEITTLYNSGASKLLAPTTNGLVAYYPMDENTGSIAHDMSGNNFHGTLVNSPTWVDGILGKALKFNGVNQHVSVACNNNFSNNKISVSLWVQFFTKITIDNEYELLRFFAGSGSKFAYSLNNDGKIYWRPFPSSNPQLISNLIPKTNTWYHIVGVYDVNTSYLYINGILDNSSSITVALSNSTRFSIGSSNTDASANYFNGLIDEVRIYNRALNQAEITTLYNAGLSKLT